MPIKVKTKDEFDELVDKIVETEKRIRQWEQDAPGFDDYSDLAREKEVAVSRLKDLARPKSVKGRTVTLVSKKEILVTVAGPQSATEYDLGKAEEFWPDNILKTSIVRHIDAKRVEKFLNNGDMSDELAEKALKPRKAATPRVTVKLFP